MPVGNAAGDAITSWWNPTSVLVGALAVVTGAYLAAVYLAADARRAGEDDLAERLPRAGRSARASWPARSRSAASRCCATTPGRSTTGSWRRRPAAGDRCSAVGGLATLALVWRRRYGLARLTGRRSRSARSSGAGRSPRTRSSCRASSRIDEAAAGRPHARGGRSSALVLGALVLVPSLAYLFRLVLRGRLDKELPREPATGRRCRERRGRPALARDRLRRGRAPALMLRVRLRPARSARGWRC